MMSDGKRLEDVQNVTRFVVARSSLIPLIRLKMDLVVQIVPPRNLQNEAHIKNCFLRNLYESK